jgi:phosphoribosylaminoimidazolecarboxamide formyltransferase / IMP cyclohydrolase
MDLKKIRTALISVYHKDNLDKILALLKQHGVQIYSTGGTQQFIESQGLEVIAVETLTGYPSILGGRVKTLHPKIFGGILYRADVSEDLSQIQEYDIPPIDLVIVDLYPFEATVASGASDEDIIEKIDIGGISLIRAAAKNFQQTTIIASQTQYTYLADILEKNQGQTSLEDRRYLATQAFHVSSHYDTAIFHYFNQKNLHQKNQSVEAFKQSIQTSQTLRYGENPHQKGVYYGNLAELLEQLNGKELSYNNLVDVDAAVCLMEEFEETAFAILKHNNACGMATGTTPKQAYLKALAGDPVSAFGGVIITNKPVDLETAEELNRLFFEVLIAPEYENKALELLSSKKNRILLRQKKGLETLYQYRTILNGVLWQDRDLKTESPTDLKTVTQREPTTDEVDALIFANKLVKHSKSNTIVLSNKDQLLASGVGQTSRVDSLKQAIEKAKNFGFNLQGAVMASDAFFPFPDCVEIAFEAGIAAVIQPGGSVKDQESIDFCDSKNMTMVFTGVRHFKH